MRRSPLRFVGLACWLCLVTTLFVLAALGLPGNAHAGWPPPADDTNFDYSSPNNWPNDDGYKDSWELWSFIPTQLLSRVSDENKRLGSGSHVDRAFAKTIGDRRVLITVLDSGADWSNDDLTNKWYLNEGELPAPDVNCLGLNLGMHDRNGDGYFNVQDYSTATGHAKATFATVCDARIKAKGDVNGNGLLDPEDLIAAFSDGTDGDNNGYVDDISGWDFFHNDNNPADDTHFGHGNGEARWSSSEGNNANGDIGTCPECTVMMVRAGDSFVTDANMFAMGVLYAVDNGTTIVQEALGAINNTPLGRAAIDYAYNNNVTIIASAADEDSFHHNMPATNNHTFYVHAITVDASGGWQNAHTFLNYNNCTNYGAQLVASVPGSACSSEATGLLSGMAGLVYSLALQKNLPLPGGTAKPGDKNMARRLTAEEVIQTLKENVDDLFDAGDATDPTKYRTLTGWEKRFGYGRINARKAVDAIDKGNIPPETEILEPKWFEVLHADRASKVDIKGRVNMAHKQAGDTVDFVLEYAPGIEPGDMDWKPITQGTMISDKMEGTLATWDISGVVVDNPTEGPPEQLTNRRLVTLRLRSVIHSADMLRVTHGEHRKAVFVERDPDLLPGYPVFLGASGEMSGKIVDINGDGKREFVFSDSGGRVHAFQSDATEVAGWPVNLSAIPSLDADLGASHAGMPAFKSGLVDPNVARSSTAFSLAVGDIDGDKKPEVVIGTYDGQVWALHGDGSKVAGWPFKIDRTTATKTNRHFVVYEGVEAAPALADMNGDGTLEVIVATMNSLVYVLKGDGTPLASFNGGKPVVVQDKREPEADILRDRIIASPTIGDLNKDGIPDIVLGTNENYDNQGRLYAIDGKTGAFLPGWPVTVTSNFILPFVGTGLPNAPAMADIDGDKVPEIFTGGIAGAVHVYNASGERFHNGVFGGTFPNNKDSYGPLSDAQNAVSVVLVANPSIGDIDDDGVLDIVQPTGGGDAALAFASGGQRRDFEHHVDAWDTATGQSKAGFPRVIEDWQFFNVASIADIDGDGHSNVLEGSGGYWIHAWDAQGKEAAGFPKLTGGWVISSVAVGDMDGDGKFDVAVNTRDGWLYAWKGKGPVTGRADWTSFGHDNANTRNYDTPLDVGGLKGTPLPDGGAGDGGSLVVSGSGCSCSIGSARDAGSSEGKSPLRSLPWQPLSLAIALLLGLAFRRPQRR